jgi:hypothetical protein
LQVLDVVEGLRFGGFEASTCALMFDENASLPEQVDESVLVLAALDGFFKRGDGAAGEAEDEEEFVPEGLLFGLFAGGGGPASRELDGVRFDFVLGELGHARGLIVPGARSAGWKG